MTNRIDLEVRAWGRGEIELTVEGEGRNELTEDRDNRFVRGLEAALRAARGDLPDEVGWRIAMHNDIPLARGLGSSAAATVGGVLAGNALVGEALSMSELLGLACAIEGHPDNAAAALLGGFVVSAAAERRRWRGRDPVRRAARPARGPVHPRAAPGDAGHARGPAGHACRSRTRSPTSARWPSASPAWPSGGTSCWHG